MADKEIIDFLKTNGPIVPSKLAKHLNISLLFASAMLGELASKNSIKISNLKIGGGSPLYFLKDQEEQLQSFSSSLNSKDKQAYELLKEKKILRDIDLTPITRVCLRQIKDFAKPLQINIQNKQEIFWKWYLLDNTQAEKIIRDFFSEIIDRKEEVIASSVVKPKQDKIEQIEAPFPQDNLRQDNGPKKDIIKEKSIKKEHKQNVIDSSLQKQVSVQTTLNEQVVKDSLNGEFDSISSGFGKKIVKYFAEKQIIIKHYEILKKNKEFSFLIEVPSVIGKSTFYCKAIDKKKLTDGEIALALIESHYKNLPSILLTTSQIAQKTTEKLATLFKDINLIKI